MSIFIAHTDFECENGCRNIIRQGDTVHRIDGKRMCFNCTLAWTAMNRTGEASGT